MLIVDTVSGVNLNVKALRRPQFVNYATRRFIQVVASLIINQLYAMNAGNVTTAHGRRSGKIMSNGTTLTC